MNHYKIEFFNGELKIVKSENDIKAVTRWAFFEYGTDFKSVKPASCDDINWYRKNNAIVSAS
jgi:hypothetical protein